MGVLILLDYKASKVEEKVFEGSGMTTPVILRASSDLRVRQDISTQYRIGWRETKTFSACKFGLTCLDHIDDYGLYCRML